MTGAVTIELAEPIQAHGEEVRALVLQAPRAKHLRAVALSGSPDIGVLLDIAAETSGLPPSAINDLAAADAMRVVEAVSTFLAPPPGGTPSP